MVSSRYWEIQAKKSFSEYLLCFLVAEKGDVSRRLVFLRSCCVSPKKFFHVYENIEFFYLIMYFYGNFLKKLSISVLKNLESIERKRMVTLEGCNHTQCYCQCWPKLSLTKQTFDLVFFFIICWVKSKFIYNTESR